MKTLVTYYSFSGNTDKVSHVIAKALKAKSEVYVQRLQPTDEIRSFFAQCGAAFTHKRALLPRGTAFDASPYDLVVIGSPVWAFAPAPAVNTYLDNLTGLNGKKALILLTSGSGVGVKRCFENIKAVLKNKGAADISQLNIPERHMKDEPFIVSSLEKLV